MKIIRRKRTVTIETCAFRQWQNEGTGDSFNCPNCGKTFDQNTELTTAIARLLPDVVEEPIEVKALPPENKQEGACDKGCADKPE